MAIATEYKHLEVELHGSLLFDNYTDHEVLYDENYLENYRKMSCTTMGHKIAGWRKAYAEAFLNTHDGKLLDYGCGWSPICNLDRRNSPDRLGDWYGTDINLAVADVPHMQNRFAIDPDLSQFEVVCFFDVLEHLVNYKKILSEIAVGNHVIATLPTLQVPILEDNFHTLLGWRHWKPAEHRIYATQYGWVELMRSCGFVYVDVTQMETVMGRLDSTTYAFKKVR